MHGHAAFNTGVLFLRPTPATLAFTQRWHDKLLAPTSDWHMEDQRGFNELVMTNFYPTVAAPGHEADGAVVQAANGSLALLPLPAAKYIPANEKKLTRKGVEAQISPKHW